MTLPRIAATVAAVILAGIFVLQLLLAAGLPLGHLAWGGRQPKSLTRGLRVASAASAIAVAAAAWIILARAGLVAPGPESSFVRVATWALAAAYVVNTIGNLMSHSRTERRVMTPLTIVLVVCFVMVALS